jgi:hypothetical protein
VRPWAETCFIAGGVFGLFWVIGRGYERRRGPQSRFNLAQAPLFLAGFWSVGLVLLAVLAVAAWA